MKSRAQILRRIERQIEEIGQLEATTREAKAFLRGLQESLKFLPKDDVPATNGQSIFRMGSDMEKARNVIEKVGQPLHVVRILQALGRPVDKKSKASLSGSIGRYARQGIIFTKAGPNTFGLIGMPHADGDELPEGFGEDKP